MKLFVKTLKGNHFEIEVQPTDKVADVKKNIETIHGQDVYPCAQQLLIHQGKVLKDETTLENNQVVEKNFLVIMLTKSKGSSAGASTTSASTNQATTAANSSPPNPPDTVSLMPQSAVAIPPPIPPAPIPPPSDAPAPTPAVTAPTDSHVYGQPSSSLVAGNNFELAIQHILDMGGGSWDRDTVVRALRAANNNPERAAEYLYSSKGSSAGALTTSASTNQATTAASSSPPNPPATVSITPQAAEAIPPPIPPFPIPPPSDAPAPTPTVTASMDTDVYAQAALDLVAGNDFEQAIEHILDMGGGSWDRDTVVRALRAAYNNPERAVEYLYSGIPAQAEPAPTLARAPTSGQAVNPPAQAAQPAAQPAVTSSRPNANPLDLFPQGVPNMGSNVGVGSLEFLRNSHQFQALRAMVQANPQILQPMLQELGKQNPNLVRLIQDHQADFLRLINEPVEGPESDLLGQLAAMPSVTVTPEERAAIERLEAMGFERSVVLEVFFACNKNEQLAANYLLDHYNEFEE